MSLLLLITFKRISLFSSLDFAVDFFGTKDAGFKSFCTHGSILYKNIFKEVDILLGYGDCLDRHEENNYNSKETFIEIRNFVFWKVKKN